MAKKNNTKYLRRIIRISLVLCAIPFALFLRLFSCFTPVKLAGIRTSQIGHFVFDTQNHLRRIQLNPQSYYLFAYFYGVQSNSQWEKMVRRRYTIHPIFHYVSLANRLFPNAQRYELDLSGGNTAESDKEGIYVRTSSEIAFNSEEQQRGMAYLEKIGMQTSEKYVCLLVREPNYKEVLDGDRDWSYHSYRDSDVNTFVDATEWLAEKGYWIIRMGKFVRDPMRSEHPKIIDYAMTEERSDFLDIWLMANCAFCITTGTGLDCVVEMADKPSVYINLLPLNHIKLYKNSLTVPKKLWWKKSGKLLNLEEYIRHGYLSTEDYQRHGIEVEGLSPLEITEVVREMEKKVCQVYDYSDENKQRQHIALSIILESDRLSHKRYQFYRDPGASIGSDFLKRYWTQLKTATLDSDIPSVTGDVK